MFIVHFTGTIQVLQKKGEKNNFQIPNGQEWKTVVFRFFLLFLSLFLLYSFSSTITPTENELWRYPWVSLKKRFFFLYFTLLSFILSLCPFTQSFVFFAVNSSHIRFLPLPLFVSAIIIAFLSFLSTVFCSHNLFLLFLSQFSISHSLDV